MKASFYLRTFLAVALSLYCATAVPAIDTIVIEAVVNDEPVRFGFDTCAESTILFRLAAQRLGLRVTDPPEHLPEAMSGRVKMGISEECRLSLGGTTTKATFCVFDMPTYLPLEVDGLIAWADVRDNIFCLGGDTGELSVLEALPENMDLWTQWSLRRDSRFLAIELPKTAGARGAIYIDTGSPYGVHLSPKRWKEWRGKHSERPFTLTSYYTPADGLVVSEECWAKELTVGQFSIGDVPVMQSTPSMNLLFKDHEAIFGLFALTRLNMIVHGQRGRVYTKPSRSFTSRYQYNRTGAVFVPKDMMSDDLIARVVRGSPAHQAGVCEGDILLKIGNLDVTNWRTDPEVLPLSRFWEQPAGTKLDLSLRRDGELFETTVELKEILFPDIADEGVSVKRSHSQQDAPADTDKPRR
ncbi:MAG: retropepsin-like aspartic protease [Planctomycetota bacterium]|jgi:hypothetical protein